MYKVIISNNSNTTLIHFSSSDPLEPHLNILRKREKDSNADIVNFTILKNNPGYNMLNELTTGILITDMRDETVVFDGRILKVTEKMDSNGLFYKEVISEGSLNYLVDTKTRKYTYELKTPTQILTDLLNKHNSKVSSNKQIRLGNIDITNATTISVNYQSTLSAIQLIKSKLGGHFKIRLQGGIRYLDYFNTINTNIRIQLGENMNDMLKENDITELGTRLIPIGKDDITIETVNNGIDYIDNPTAINKYDIIEKIVEYRDIEDPVQLKAQMLNDMSKHTQPKQMLESSAFDLSVLSNTSSDKFTINKNIRIINPIMAIDAVYEIVEMENDLLQAYNPRLIISNNPDRLTDAIVDFNSTKSLVNSVISDDGTISTDKLDGKINTQYLDGVIDALKNQLVASGSYSNVQVVADKGLLFENTNAQSADYGALYLGPGIFAIANSKTSNGNWNWRSFGTGRGFTADEIVGGILKGIKIQEISNYGTLLAELYKNDKGGLMKILDNDGNLNVTVGSENGTSMNNGGTLILYDDGSDKPRLELGISKDYHSGTINLKDNNGVVRAALYGGGFTGPIIAIMNSNGSLRSYLTESTGKINSETIATQNWVRDNAGGGASGGLGYGGAKIYLNPNDSSRLYIQRDTDGALSIHDDSSTYVKISASACTWY